LVIQLYHILKVIRTQLYHILKVVQVQLFHILKVEFLGLEVSTVKKMGIGQSLYWFSFEIVWYVPLNLVPSKISLGLVIFRMNVPIISKER
jgi:hypothetical protein